MNRYGTEDLQELADRGLKAGRKRHLKIREFESLIKGLGGLVKPELSKGGHRKFRLGRYDFTYSERKRGKEPLISWGVLDEIIKKISTAFQVSEVLLEYYFKGTGKLHKSYCKKFTQYFRHLL